EAEYRVRKPQPPYLAGTCRGGTWRCHRPFSTAVPPLPIEDRWSDIWRPLVAGALDDFMGQAAPAASFRDGLLRNARRVYARDLPDKSAYRTKVEEVHVPSEMSVGQARSRLPHKTQTAGDGPAVTQSLDRSGSDRSRNPLMQLLLRRRADLA